MSELQATITPSPASVALVRQLSPEKLQQALRAIANRSSTTMAADMARRIAAHVKMPVGEIKDLIRVTRADAGRGALVKLSRKNVPLVYYIPNSRRETVKRLLRSGLARRVRPAGGLVVSPRKLPSGKYAPTQTLPGGFFAIFKSGHLGIMERLTGERFPLRQLMGPNPLGIYLFAAGVEGMETVCDETEIKTATAIENNTASQLKRFGME